MSGNGKTQALAMIMYMAERKFGCRSNQVKLHAVLDRSPFLWTIIEI